MKAITCSQCGALIKGVSAKTDFVNCNYCGAELPVKLDKIAEIPEPPEINLLLDSDESPDPRNQGNFNVAIYAIVGALGLLILVPLFLASIFSKKPEPEQPKPRIAASSPIVIETPIFPLVTPTSFPDFSYRAYVKHFTDIGVEDIVVPTISADQLPTMDLVELKKTVFKEKRLKVRITINPDGEVIEAKPLNGHPALQAICVEAARKSLFTTRKKNYTTDLTYIFVIED